MRSTQDPSVELVSFNCPHCGALAHQSWYNLFVMRLKKNVTPNIFGEGHLARLEKLDIPDNEFRQNFIETVHRCMAGDILFGHVTDAPYTNEQLENVHVGQCYFV